MGCCLTTAAIDDSKTNLKPPAAPPPPLVFEEETVKEVLSETPVISKQPPPANSSPTKTQHTILQPQQEFRSEHVLSKDPVEENASEVSSEMYTYSASFSAATTTTIGTGGVDEDGEVTQKIKKPPPAKTVRRRPPPTYSGLRKERGVRPRPPPPVRRSPVPSKPQVPSRNVTTTQRQRNVVASNVVRREPPGRRSRSPAMREEAGQLRKVRERSPVRKHGNGAPVNRREVGGNVKVKKSNDGGVESESETETCESLENPLVSLECFIFL